MDTAVALVQAYLHVNGYFTVTEYLVLEAVHREHTRSVTDLDVLASRFAHAAHDLERGSGRRHLDEEPPIPDPVLGCAADRPDMIVGEVKEGLARFDAAARDPVVLEVALTRFGCCPPAHVARAPMRHRGVPAGLPAAATGRVATCAASRARLRGTRPH